MSRFVCTISCNLYVFLPLIIILYGNHVVVIQSLAKDRKVDIDNNNNMLMHNLYVTTWIIKVIRNRCGCLGVMNFAKRVLYWFKDS